ncbi:ABC transporter permease [Methanofollis sp. UBA420]|jgi:ABC-2 type transport system permease protein|uniref:ABC transporter permease n=1 Tax=Methanofollis sp. UBA420 TaxID=1915514 RepID=UPI00316AD00B
MRTEGMRVIAAKEFRDHMGSRRFLGIFAVMLLLAAVGMVSGVGLYQAALEKYNAAQTIVSGDAGDSSGQGAPSSPAVMGLFHIVGYPSVTLWAFLGVAMGFDLITREKESRSLKVLLSHPIYRDEVITGKALGGAAAIAVGVVVMLLLCVSVLLLSGIVLRPDEVVRVALFGLFSYLLILSFFLIALFFSTVAETSGGALVSSLFVLAVLLVLLPLVVNNPLVISAAVGDLPESPEWVFESGMSDEEIRAVLDEYDRKNDAYYDGRMAFMSTAMIASPSWNYLEVMAAVTIPSHMTEDLSDEEAESLGAVFGILAGCADHLIALLVVPAAFFGLAWVRFLRADIR